MKRFQKPYIVIFVTLLLFSSCAKEDESNKFIGEWWLVHAGFDTPNLEADFVAAAKHSLESSLFFFEEENNFQIEDTSMTGGNYLGKWEYSAEKGQLILTYTDLPVDPEIFDVLKLTRNKMVIRQTQESIGILEYQLERR